MFRLLRRGACAVLLVLAPGPVRQAAAQPAAEPAAGPSAGAPGADAAGEGAAEAGTPAPDVAPDAPAEPSAVRPPRAGASAAAPVTVVDRSQLQAWGRASLGELLQRLPVQGNAANTAVNNGGDGSTRIDLRSLGTGRTLVLLNGRRFVPGGTGASASVDLDALPAHAIERVEVLRGGAAAAHGSDAVSGVVNVVTRRGAAGTELSAFSGLSGRGDGLQVDLGLTTGLASSRGELLVSASYLQQQPVFADARPFSALDTVFDWERMAERTTGSTATPNGVIADSREDTSAAWDAFLASSGGGRQFTFEPALGRYRPFDGSTVQEEGGDLWNYQPANYLLTPSRRLTAYASGGYALTGDVRGSVELLYGHRRSEQRLAPEPLFTLTEGLVVSGESVYNPFGRDFVDVRRRMVEVGPRSAQQDLHTVHASAALEGTLRELGGWGWDAAVSYGRTLGSVDHRGHLQRSRLAAAVGPSFRDAGGLARCGTGPADVVEGCVPLDLFGGAGSITPEQAAFISFSGVGQESNELLQVGAGAHGALPRLLGAREAGSVRVGMEYRRHAAASVPDPLAAVGGATGTLPEHVEGAVQFTDAHAAVSLPLLGRPDGSAVPGDLLALEGAARLSLDAATAKAATAFAAGVRLSPSPDLTLRARVSGDFRAPSLVERFTPQRDPLLFVADPCSDRAQGSLTDSLCDAEGVPDDLGAPRVPPRAVVGGNPALLPETARTLSFGALYTPAALESLSLTLDVWSTDVSDTVSSFGADALLAACYGGTAPRALCAARIQRHPDSRQLLRVDDTAANVGALGASGVDLGVRFQPRTALGQLSVRADVTYLGAYVQTGASGGTLQARGTYDLLRVLPDWRGLLGLAWTAGPLSAGLDLSYVGGFQECQANTCAAPPAAGLQAPATPSRRVDAYVRTDVNVGLRLGTPAGATRVTLGVSNLLDAQPVFIANAFLSNSDPATYDYLGRAFFARVTHGFE
jgi:outer membrane receptor protein involved in Fe transport